jgi:cytochrome b5
MRAISAEELSQHSDSKDCWIAVHGIVMDITSFLNEHPGGPDVVVSVSGKDCTHDFEDVGHTDSARKMGKPHIIGVLDTSGIDPSDPDLHIPTNKELHERQDSSASNTGSMTRLLGVSASIACMAALLYAFVVNK